MAPVAAAERIALLDVLRGVALFGILVVNMSSFSGPFQATLTPSSFSSAADWVVTGFIQFFAQGKFYTLFSFLFGLGLYLQMNRAEARGARFVPIYLRRLVILLAIGLVHAIFIWAGDILVLYALLGLLSLPFRHRAPRTLLIWSGVCFSVLPILALAGFALTATLSDYSEQVQGSVEATRPDQEPTIAQIRRTYATGSYGEITQQRLRDLSLSYTAGLIVVPHVFAMFLLGLYAGRRSLFRDLPRHQSLVGWVLRCGLVVGLVANTIATAPLLTLATSQSGTSDLLAALRGLAALQIGGTAFCLMYIAALTMLFQRPGWPRHLAPLAAVGRMALSNYLLQSVVSTMIFYSYGLGLFGQVGPTVGLALTVLIYALQVLLSVWWLRCFSFGPMEWLWRSLTYLRRQPVSNAPTSG